MSGWVVPLWAVDGQTGAGGGGVSGWHLRRLASLVQEGDMGFGSLGTRVRILELLLVALDFGQIINLLQPRFLMCKGKIIKLTSVGFD